MISKSLLLPEPASPAHICPFDQACSYLEAAAKELNLNQGLLEILSHPRKVVTVSIPVKLDDGEIRVLAGHRVQHSDVLGPYKGGIRYHPGCDTAGSIRSSNADDLEMCFVRYSLRWWEGSAFP